MLGCHAISICHAYSPGYPQSHPKPMIKTAHVTTFYRRLYITSRVPLDAPPERWDVHVESDKQASNMGCESLWWTLSFAIEENQKIKKAWRSMTNNRKSLPRNVAGFESVSPALHSQLQEYTSHAQLATLKWEKTISLVSLPVQLFAALQHQISCCFQDLLIIRS